MFTTLPKWAYAMSVLVFALIATAIAYNIFGTAPPRLVDAKVAIGFIGPLSGEASSYGFSIIKGIELAKKELGANLVEIISKDTRCDKELTKQAIAALDEMGVVAIIGEACSGSTLAAVPVAERSGIVLVSPSATTPELSGKSRLFFRTAPSDTRQGEMGARVAYTMGIRSLAILHTNEEYGLAFSKVLQREFTKQGGTVTIVRPFDPGVIQFDTVARDIVSGKPDGIYLISNAPTSGAVAIRSLRSQGYTGQLLGSEGFWGNVILKEAGRAAEGLTVLAMSVGTKRFKQAHRLEFGVDAGPYAAQGFDAFQAIWLALQDGATDRRDLAARLRGVDFEGVSGHIRFDDKGDIEGGYEVLRVSNSTFVPVSIGN